MRNPDHRGFEPGNSQPAVEAALLDDKALGETGRPLTALPLLSPDLVEAHRLAGLGIWRWKVGTQEFSWSDELYRISGRDMLTFDVTLDGALDCIHPDDREAVARRLRGLNATDRPVAWQFRIVRPDGGIRWCVGEARPVIDHTGRVAMLRGFCQDITERREAEDRLRERERQLETLIDNLPGMAYRCAARAPWPFTFASEGVETLTGYASDEFVARGRTWGDLVHPQDMRRLVREADAALVAGRPFSVVYRIVHRDGDIRWVHERGQGVRDDAGQVMFIEGFIGDVTEQKRAEEALRESEEHYRYTVELNPQIPWTADPAGNILEVSGRWLDFTGMTRAETMAQGWTTAVHPDDIDRVAELWSRSIATGQPLDARYRVRKHDGSYRWVRARAGARRANGTILRWYGMLEDIHDKVAATEALSASEERYRLVARATNDAIWDWDATADHTSWNEAIATHFGHPDAPAGTSGDWREALIHPDDREQIIRRVHTALADGSERWGGEYRFLKGDGSYADVYDCGYIIRDPSGKATRMVGAMLDVSERKQAAAALQDREERLRLAVQVTGLGIWDFDVATGARRWSDELRSILGLGPDVPAELDAALPLVRADHRGRIAGFFQALHAGTHDFHIDQMLPINRADTGEERWISTNGHRIFDAQGKLRRVILTIRDITEERTAEERIRWAANHDALTGLPNRAHFQEQLQRELDHAARVNSTIGLLMLDVDHFKQINDTLGHDAGDALLRSFAERLRTCVRGTDFVARLGGDEFAVILPEFGGEPHVAEAAESILARLREPFVFGGRALDCRASIGAAIYPEHGIEHDELLKHADLALYSAKAAGRGGIQTFRSEMRADMQRHSSMLTMARGALDADAIVPYYQPKVEMSSGRIAGFEALLRWRRPGGRVELPATIGAALEDSELAVDLGKRMLARVVGDLRRWLDAGVDVGHVAINASAAEFRQGDFAGRLLEQLRRADIPTNRIELEVTETVFLGRGAECVERALRTLSAAGVRIALDDFGTGYASLSHLKQFPVDIIKIDRSFVRDLEDDPGDAAIIRAVVHLGQSLGIRIVAEGIETSAQAAYLWAQGCDFGQGYLFGRPIFAADVPTLMRTWTPNGAWKRPAARS